jgi:hypothetical protein
MMALDACRARIDAGRCYISAVFPATYRRASLSLIDDPLLSLIDRRGWLGPSAIS